MKTIVVILAFLLSSTLVYSQKPVDIKKVPDKVLRTFKKKASRATDVKWFKLKDGQEYMASFVVGKQPGEAHFTYEGKVLIVKVKMDYRKLPTSVQRDISKKHRDKKVYEVWNVFKTKKDKYYSIILHKKQGRKKPPLVYEVQYTLQGRYLTTYEPEIKEDTSDEKSIDRFDVRVDEDMNEIKGQARDEKVKRKDLPTLIENYLSKNYNYEYKAKTILLKKNTKYGQYYYIVMKKQGEKQEYHLWFDYKGQFIKKRVVGL